MLSAGGRHGGASGRQKDRGRRFTAVLFDDNYNGWRRGCVRTGRTAWREGLPSGICGVITLKPEEKVRMPCPRCASSATYERTERTALGYRTYRCTVCHSRFNERTGTPFNFLELPTDIVLLAVVWRLRYKLSLRDVAELLLDRGFTVTHEAVREWEARFTPLLSEQLRAKRRRKAGDSWYCDETYIKVAGRWCYLYRAIDRDGNLVDSMLSETRDMEAAKRFCSQAREVVGHPPERVTTDGHDAYPRAIRESCGENVTHRYSRYLNNRLEQDHRGVKQRYYPMRGFGSFGAAARFCTAFDELRDHFRYRECMGDTVSLADQRRIFGERLAEVRALMQAA
jgi:putative transposase